MVDYNLVHPPMAFWGLPPTTTSEGSYGYTGGAAESIHVSLALEARLVPGRFFKLQAARLWHEVGS